MKCPNCEQHATSYFKFIKVSLIKSFITKNKGIKCQNCGEELNSDPFGINNFWTGFISALFGAYFAKHFNPTVFDNKLMDTFLVEFPLFILFVLMLLFFVWLFMNDKRFEQAKAQ